MNKSGFAPKCRVLTTDEKPGTFENWKDTLIFNLTLDGTFEFLSKDDVKWASINTVNRGMVADTEGTEQNK